MSITSLPAASRRAQTHDAATLDRQSWPIAAGLLQFPDPLPDGTSVRALGPDAWRASLLQVADAGFDQVELTDVWLKAGDLDAAERAELRAAADDAGLRIAAVAAIRRSVIHADSAKANLAYSHRSIDAAAELGAPVFSLGLHEPLHPAQKQALWFWTESGAVNDPADLHRWDAAVRSIRELADHASEVGVLLTLEMYEDTYLGTAESSVRLVEEIDRDNVGLNPDTGNLIRLHRPIEDWREVLTRVLPYTNYWHVKNYARDEDATAGLYTAVPTSMALGLIDYRWAVQEAIAAGFAGTITCEHYGGDGLSVSAQNRDYLRTILPRTAPTEGHRP
ncbi:sugar phosphate isomerase/epimerase family protein [Microbacterium sp. SA39]|uniref:sugar phosphate isomerase/epimerase family protein n=1 Tax=Microbacterium sp. SA39 TaxID=1263625 RepID=UPI00061F373E|nr:sugar phosphate isomerase/epimerase family protein [Microbacterium sp. SA39]KJQ53883.1 Xylose isomerase-like TIM barrel [Microbacterium sp. SA39]